MLAVDASLRVRAAVQWRGPWPGRLEVFPSSSVTSFAGAPARRLFHSSRVIFLPSRLPSLTPPSLTNGCAASSTALATAGSSFHRAFRLFTLNSYLDAFMVIAKS